MELFAGNQNKHPAAEHSTLSKLLLGLLLALPFVIFFPIANKIELPQWYTAGIAITLLVVVWLLRSRQPIKWTPLHTWVALTSGVVLALGTYHSKAPGVQDAMLQQLTLALLFLLGAQLLSSRSGLRQLLWVTVTTGSLVALIGIIQHLSNSNLGLTAVNNGASVFINRNWAAGFMNLATPAALVLLFRAEGHRATCLAALGYFLCLSYSLVTLSQGHWLALAAALCVLLILFRFNPQIRATFASSRRRLTIATVSSLISPLILILPSLVYEPLPGTGDQSTYSGSISARLNFYRNTLEMISDSPLTGSGPGTFYTSFQSYYSNPVNITTTTEIKGVANAHNDYLEYLAELGIPAGILMILLLATIWYSAWKMANNRNSPDQAIIGAAFLLSITALYFHALVDFPLSTPTPSIWLWTLAGALSIVWVDRARNQASIPFTRSMRKPVAMLLFFYLGLISFNGYSALRAHILINQAAKLSMKKECENAVELAFDSTVLRPKDYLIWQYQLLVHGHCKSDMQTQYRQASLVLQQAPSHPYALLVKANALLESGQIKLAQEGYKQLVKLLPHRALGYLGLANTLVLEGDTTSAQALYQKSNDAALRIGSGWQAGPAGQNLANLTHRVLAWSNRQKENSLQLQDRKSDSGFEADIHLSELGGQ